MSGYPHQSKRSS